MRYALFGILLFLTACAGTAETRATNALAAACDGYQTVLAQLVPRKADMSPETIERINKTNETVDVVCLPDSVVDPVEAVGSVREAIGVLKAIKDAF